MVLGKRSIDSASLNVYYEDDHGTVTSNEEDDSVAQLETAGVTHFIRKAFKLVSSCNPKVGGWDAEGKLICIHDPEAFAKKEIPRMFRHSNFSSFVRQLHVYGFRKIRSDEVDGPSYFKHPYFQRGRVDLLSLLTRGVNSSDHVEAPVMLAPSTNEDSTRAVLQELQAKVRMIVNSNAALERQVEVLRAALVDLKSRTVQNESSDITLVPLESVKSVDVDLLSSGGYPLRRINSSWTNFLDTII